MGYNILAPPGPTYFPTSLRKKPDLLDIFVSNTPSNLFLMTGNLLEPTSDHSAVLLTDTRIQQMILLKKLYRNLKAKNSKYSPAIRGFALTLQFYSSKAYSFVRKTFQHLLPHPATILIDEMAIRKQVSFMNNKFYGCVDLGTGNKVDQYNAKEATNERANLLSKCLELFSNTGAKCNSNIDGTPNLAMCTSLGANFNYYSDNFQPWFYNPSKPQEKIFVFWDAAHILKLVRR
ncbi:uncharacterized protein LOC111032661 [Myzus persicae]|uniref:uncharacterized protein LOC111032661 n=1 Tax=Myzus persicae TaxID=13164 RepID=UPI000B932F8E|nr:uncharacterized protein LOC111032661 [Myzus persicae]